MRLPNLRDAGLTAWLVAAVLLGFLVLPALIYVAGSAALGRYEGASVGNLYRSVYQGLGHGNLASWIVVLGPAALILLARGLKPLWHMSKSQAE